MKERAHTISISLEGVVIYKLPFNEFGHNILLPISSLKEF
jgi:hypothetical protein